MPTTVLSDHTMSVSQAARLAGVTPAAVRQWLRQGRLSAGETPLGRLIPRRELEQFIAARERAGTVKGDDHA